MLLASRLALQRQGLQRACANFGSRVAHSTASGGGGGAGGSAGAGGASAASAGKKAAGASTRAARRRGNRKKAAGGGGGGGAGKWLALGGVVAGAAGGAYYLDVFDSGQETKTRRDGTHNPTQEGSGSFAGFVHDLIGSVRGENEANDGKLLPDYENSVFFQEGAPPPLTVVIDLEETLGTSTWDRRHGWRFVKRPGLDVFLSTMARYGVEVVVFSMNPSVGAVEDTLARLDPMGQFIPYKLYCNSAAFKDSKYVKDLSKLNRDFKRVIVVDNNLEDVATNLENCIQVKSFDDIEVTQDDTLHRLAGFIQAMAVGVAQGQVTDVRAELRKFKPKRSADSAEEGPSFLDNYARFLKAFKRERAERRSSGIGGMLRGKIGQQLQQQQPQPQAALADEPSEPRRQYRKTIWERMTDPQAVQKQEKELMGKEQAWQQYYKSQLRQ